MIATSRQARRENAAKRISANAPKPRRELSEAMARTDRNGRPSIQARYDAAENGDEFANYWAKADQLSPDFSNSKSVRQTLVARARYESESNGLSDGIIQTHANYIVSKGPTLRMQTGSANFNRMIESEWERWAKAIQFRRKLHCMAMAKTQDGEAFGILRNNPGLKTRIKLDLVLIETEQCQTPWLPFGEIGYIDGVKFDQYGNFEQYDILKQHPGGQWGMFGNSFVPEQVPAKYVLHWFALRRPGLHRGVPELRSSLNVGASSRRMREATVSAVETAASMGAALLKTNSASVTPEELQAGSSIDLKRRMMTVLPYGHDVQQMKSEFPNATYKEFQRSQTSEQGRPISMPHNLAASDSSDHNFASGRLDFIPYYMQVDCVRFDGDDCVCDKAFAVWFSEASREFGWYGDPDSPPAHTWDWPPHPVADQEADASAKAKRLQTGQTTFTDIYADAGEDFEDVLIRMANDMFGDDEENNFPGSEYKTQAERNRAMRAMLRNTTYNSKAEQASILQVEENNNAPSKTAPAEPATAT